MNILLIDHYAGSPTLGMEYRPYYMAREWQKAGHNVIIVAASNAHVRSKQFELKNKFEEHCIEGINYLLVKTPLYSGNDFRRVINMTEFVRALYQNSKLIARKYNPNVVIASSTYPMDIYPAKKIADYSQAKLIFEVHDLWPLSPIELGGYSKWHPFIMAVQHAENYAFKNASAVVSIWPKASEYMSEHGLGKGKFNYIPNGIVVDEWDVNKTLPADIDDIINHLKNNKQIIVGYAGSHGLANALDSLICSAKILEKENIAFLLIGDGPEKKNLMTFKEKINAKNVHFTSTVHKNQVPALLNKLDILYIGLQNQQLFKYGLCPNKMIDYMMAGKPVIQAYKAGINLVEEANCGLLVEPENPEAITEAIKKLSLLPKEKLKKLGENGKKYCLKNHDYNIIANKFLDIIKS